METIGRHGLAHARSISFPSVVWAGETSSLAEIKAVDAAYPLRGQVLVADAPFAPARPAAGVPGPGEAWGEPRLLARLGVDVGAVLQVGEAALTVTHVLDQLPDQGFQFVDLAPTLLMNVADVPATGLVRPGSRVTYRLLLAGEPAAVAASRSDLETELEPGERLTGLEDVRPEIRSALRRAQQFLGLAALVAVMISAVALVMGARRYAQRHLDAAALMKCLGASQALVFRLGLLQLSALALIGGVLGTCLGYLAQAMLAFLLADWTGGELPAPTADGFLLGPATALVMVLCFALPPMGQLRRVPPLRVLRHDLAPAPRNLVVYAAAVAALFAGLAWILREPRLVWLASAALGATVLLLAAAGWLMVRALKGIRGGAGAAWRFGLASAARRRGETVVQVVAFGLGLMVLLLLSVVRGDLLATWQATLPENAPNNFLINIQPAERDRLAAILSAAGIGDTGFWPLVRARMITINGRPVTAADSVSERGRRFLEREANLSWTEALQADNRIVAGRWWSGSAPGEASLEQEFAAALGIGLGDLLGFDVAGETIEVRVVSIREVEWDSFRPNFFILLSPGTLAETAGTFISSVYVPAGSRSVFLDIARELPGVTVFDVEAILAQVRGVMDKAALAVQAVFAFTLAAGLVVLLVAVQVTRDERRYEAAVLRTLGARRKMVLTAVAAEFVAIGLLAGLLAAVGAGAAGALLAAEVFDLEYGGSGLLWLGGLVAGALLVGVSGTLAARSAVDQPPVATLRRA
jgi:putative ABC transport system permease protein